MLPEITVMDGGMGVELIRRDASKRTELWSAQALLDAPETVQAVHRDYIDAGARMIITNSYSTIPSYLGKLGLQDRYAELTSVAGELARSAADSSPHKVLVAGSLPPLSESYRSDLVPDEVTAAPIYDQLAQALSPHVDLFLCETMSCAREGRTAAEAATRYAQGRPVHVAWTLAEQAGAGLRSGESIEEALAAIDHLDVAALLFNCTSPEAIVHALQELRGLTDRPLGAYPNLMHIPAGWTLDSETVKTGYRSMELAEFVEFTRRFVDAGASIIGGCCGIGPDYIRALADSLRSDS